MFKRIFTCVSNTGCHLFTTELSVPLFIQCSQSIISSDYLQIWNVKCFNQQLVFRRASNSLPLETDAQKVGLGSLINFKIDTYIHTHTHEQMSDGVLGAEKDCDTLSNDSIVMLLFLQHTSAMKCYALEIEQTAAISRHVVANGSLDKATKHMCLASLCFL